MMNDNSFYEHQPGGGMPNMINPLGMATSLGMPGVPAFYKFVELIVSKSVSGFTLQYPKLMIQLAPLMIAECLNEYQKNCMITNMTRYFIMLLSPIINGLQYDEDYEPDEANEFKRRFDNLKAHSEACGNVKIESRIVRDGQLMKYSFGTHHSAYRPKPGEYDGKVTEEEIKESEEKIRNADLEPITALVECSQSEVSIGWSIARDNGYNRINCHAENTFTEALMLCADLGMVGFTDALVFEERSVSPDDVDGRIRRQKSLHRKKRLPDENISEGDDEN
jgi:hypothetical protein